MHKMARDLEGIISIVKSVLKKAVVLDSASIKGTERIRMLQCSTWNIRIAPTVRALEKETERQIEYQENKK